VLVQPAGSCWVLRSAPSLLADLSTAQLPTANSVHNLVLADCWQHPAGLQMAIVGSISVCNAALVL
jgi:hypothetical protein